MCELNNEEELKNTIFYDTDLSEAFVIIRNEEKFDGCIADIVSLICNNELSKKNINIILNNFDIYDIENIKFDMLDLMISYINFIIRDHIITENEWKSAKILKLHFKIKEGDFYKYRYGDVKTICQKQYARVIGDNVIDYDKELFMVGMQDVFDLSYDQLYKLIDYANTNTNPRNRCC